MNVTEFTKSIVEDLQYLPPEKVAEVGDYVRFLKSSYALRGEFTNGRF